jgi:hypothetical protein
MRTVSVAVMCSALAGFWGAAPPALAQQKTEKACQREWAANKAIFQPKGITEEEYVDECRDFRAAPVAPAAPKEAPHGAALAPTKSAAKEAKHAAARTAIPAAKPTQTSIPKPENRRTTAPP